MKIAAEILSCFDKFSDMMPPEKVSGKTSGCQYESDANTIFNSFIDSSSVMANATEVSQFFATKPIIVGAERKAQKMINIKAARNFMGANLDGETSKKKGQAII